MTLTGANIVPDLQSSLLCDDVRQERNGKFMLIVLFDGLGVPQYPAVFQKLCKPNYLILKFTYYWSIPAASGQT